MYRPNYVNEPITLPDVDGLFQLAGQQVLLEEGMLEKFTLSLKPQSPRSAPANIQQGKNKKKKD